MSCASGFEYILRMGETPEKVAQELLKQVEEKEECKDKNKYEMALTIVRNDLQRKIQEGTDANTRNRLKAVSDKILFQQDNEKKKQDNLEFARKFKQEQSVRSSVASDTSSTQPQTGTTAKTPEELQKEREKNIAEYEAARKAQEQKKKKRYFGLFGGNKTKKSKKGMSLCAKKTAKKCEKVRGCKVASGTKRTYCRKKKNHSKKSHKK